MPDGELNLEPDRARHAARDLAAAGHHLGALRNGPGAALTALSSSPPWGNDEIGGAFEGKYRGIENSIMEAWTALAQHLRTLGEHAAHSVDMNTQTDIEASHRVVRTQKPL